MEEDFDDEGSGLELVHVSDVLDYLGDLFMFGFRSFSIFSNIT